MADQIKKIEIREKGDGTYNQLLYPRTSVDMVDGAVPSSRTINGKSLSGNISLTAADVGAVPTSRTVNGLALSSNITLNHNHVGAVNAVSSGSTADPNTTQEPYILTNHANSPGQGVYWHIHTYFYSSKTGNRAQQAISYNGAEPKMFIRHNYGGSWTSWKEVGGNMSAIKSIQRGVVTFPSDSETVSITISSVDVSKTIVIIDGTSVLNSGLGVTHVPYLDSLTSTTLRLRTKKYSSSGNSYYPVSWQVVEYN